MHFKGSVQQKNKDCTKFVLIECSAVKDRKQTCWHNLLRIKKNSRQLTEMPKVYWKILGVVKKSVGTFLKTMTCYIAHLKGVSLEF